MGYTQRIQEIQVDRQIADTFWLRLGATGYYGIVCILALYRFGVIILRREAADDLTPPASHDLCVPRLHKLVLARHPEQEGRSNRRCSLWRFLLRTDWASPLAWPGLPPVLQGFECAIIMAGLIALTPGLIHALSNGRSQISPGNSLSQ